MQYGLHYCPNCLAEDKEPYFRRKWRLTFVTICENHHRVLHDRCPCCGAAVNFHRNELGDYRNFAPASMTLCYSCNFDLRNVSKGTSRSRPVTAEEMDFTTNLIQLLNREIHRVGNLSFTYPHQFFSGLRQFIKILGMRDRDIANLRDAICDTYKVEPYVPIGLEINKSARDEFQDALGGLRCARRF